MIFKIMIFLILCILSFIKVNAEIIYKEFNKPSYDLIDIPVSVLQSQAAAGDTKAEYLLAVHKVVYDNQEEEGVKELEQLAASGVLDASQALYKISNRVKVDSLTEEKALAYLKQGAEGGYAISQLELAKVYYKGVLVTKDLQKYHYWLEKAAEQGQADALIYTAGDYFVGQGVSKNDIKGFEWLIRAYNVLGRDFNKWGLLAEAYETGRGTPVDLVKAYMCYDLQGTAGIEKKRTYCAADDRGAESRRPASFRRVAGKKSRLYDAIVRVETSKRWQLSVMLC